MDELYYIVFLPIVSGIILFAFPERIRLVKGIIALLISVISLFFSIRLYSFTPGIVNLDFFSPVFSGNPLIYSLLQGMAKFSYFNIDALSKFITLAICSFAVLLSIYSLGYITRKTYIRNYYPYFIIALGLSTGAALTDHLLLFIGFWGALGLTLYKLIEGIDEGSSSAAKKTLIIIGSSDGIMILGIGIIWKVYGTFSMSMLDIPTSYPILVGAFLALLTGSFTKAGAFPFHTWIPDYTQHAPASSSAYLPASLDKLLGIYFLARICTDMFILSQGLILLLLIVGVMTIIFAVMMALVQHNYKRLLGYHAVSQVGYMVVGFGLGTPLGIAGGLFHMINNALYKSGLFLSAGNVERRTGCDDLDELGGLSGAMPVTFISALICALAISGVPPLNGFASKWLIYQGIIDFGKTPGLANQLWFLWLGLAVVGSALTLASFIKYISGIFLGRKREELKEVREVNITMWLPVSIITILCLGFGVLASRVIVPKLIMPAAGDFSYIGIWNSTAVSLLIIVSIILGILIYLAGNIRNFRIKDSFIGGEILQDQVSFSVVEYYKTIREFRLFRIIYDRAEKKWFDLYDLSRRLTLAFSKWLSLAHSGVLTSYAIWVFIGIVIMLIILI
ncbi:MAG: hypothetical protein JSV24_07855 [Bacteroidales bacterium]|nr:MAG: hypothetical protein JSV24_07855 [Bacteroidales bacterium]